MKKSILYLLVTIITMTSAIGQIQINESMPFQSDPSKDYSIVIPSSYTEGTPIAAFLALHPWNTDRWNAETWCEELADFAEANDVILICPDGGDDGQIDDPIDTAFTTFLLDSSFVWYDINPDELYAIGFSWGGKTVYMYGLNHIQRFAGLMPIGAAVNVNEVDGIAQNIDGKPVYVVHGSFDSPNVRYYPLIESMEDNGGCVESNLLSGVGHTIDFDDQVEILSNAYTYLKDNNCNTTSTTSVSAKEKILPYNTIERGQSIQLYERANWIIYDTKGTKKQSGTTKWIDLNLPSGYYIIRVGDQSEQFFVR